MQKYLKNITDKRKEELFMPIFTGELALKLLEKQVIEKKKLLMNNNLSKDERELLKMKINKLRESIDIIQQN